MQTQLIRLLATLAACGLLWAAESRSLFDKDNLLAWCIVPFDARKRGPEERAAMMKRMGITRFVYDWRDKDIPAFDQEIDALQRHGIRLDGFWTPYPMDPERPNRLDVILDLLKRRGLRTELWLSLGGSRTFEAASDDEKVRIASEAVVRVARRARAIGCKVGLYNHGGWYGEPENQIRIIERVKMDNVGIVYNFHHGHDHVARFPQVLARMLPHLLAININGMKVGGPKILPVGSGDREVEMLQAVVRSGYRGPIGVLGHREEIDAEEALRLNMDGLAKIRPSIGPHTVRNDVPQPGEPVTVLRYFKVRKGSYEEFRKVSVEGVWPYFEKIGARVVGMWKVVHPDDVPAHKGKDPAEYDEIYLLTRYAGVAHWKATRQAHELGGNGPDWRKYMDALERRRQLTISTHETFLSGPMAPGGPFFMPPVK